MAKFCIFCGCPPIDKNKEHVVPHWLIKATGNPNRKAWFGFVFSAQEPTKDREFAFDQFTFPACEKCNDKYSALESKVQKIFTTILDEGKINSTEATYMLDWFDKVRVGLWLGFNQLDKNLYEVEPNFHIERRIGQYDRILIIEKTDYKEKRLGFAGVNTPAFAYTPSAFSLSVNQYCFTNISYNFLFARRIGFPYPDKLEMIPDRNELQCNIMPARCRVMNPLIQRHIKEVGTVIYQPMFPQGLMSEKSSKYNNKYVKEKSIDFESGIGRIFLHCEDEKPYWIDDDEEFFLTPKTIQHGHQQHIKAAINISEWQNWLNNDNFSVDQLDSESRKFVRSRQNMAKKINNILIDHHQNLLKKYGYSQ